MALRISSSYLPADLVFLVMSSLYTNDSTKISLAGNDVY